MTNMYKIKKRVVSDAVRGTYVGPRLVSTRIVYYAITVDQSSGLLGKRNIHDEDIKTKKEEKILKNEENKLC